MSYFQQHPREIFPFGLGECDKIVLRSECGLQTGPYYQLAGQPANIVSSNVTATTFTFTAIAGHFDYNPDFPDSGQITFRIYQGAGRIFLQQKARAIPVWGTPSGPAAGWPVHSQSRIGPLGDALDAGVPYVALSEWATQWQNLRRIFNPNND
jgi:hypothetical protein